MAWCRQATSHYLNQCWPRSPKPFGVTRSQWVKFCQWSRYIFFKCLDITAVISCTKWCNDYLFKLIGKCETNFSIFIKVAIKIELCSIFFNLVSRLARILIKIWFSIECKWFYGASLNINPHPVIRGLWGPWRHENCHYLKFYFNLGLGFHIILKNVACYHSWTFLYLVGELKNNYFKFNENCT